MPRVNYSRQELTTTITDPNSFNGILCLENTKPLLQRKKSSYGDIYKQTKERLSTKPIRKLIQHKNKEVTYLKEDNDQGTFIFGANESRLSARKKCQERCISDTTICDDRDLFSAHCYTLDMNLGRMNRRKKCKTQSITKQSNALKALRCQGEHKIHQRGSKRHKNANSRPTIENVGKKTVPDCEHLYLKSTEEKDYKPWIKTQRAGFEETNTLNPTEQESLKQRLCRKVYTHEKTNITNPKSASSRPASRTSCPQSYVKTSIISQSDSLMQSKRSAVRILKASHPKTWIF